MRLAAVCAGRPITLECKQDDRIATVPALETAILGGGCFWCLEAVFLEVEGVHAVTSGYCGGHVDAPTYRAVCAGGTGHAEVVKIDFDPAVVGYRELLEIFFTIHDPTTVDRQGNDVGPQYRSRSSSPATTSCIPRWR